MKYVSLYQACKRGYSEWVVEIPEKESTPAAGPSRVVRASPPLTGVPVRDRAGDQLGLDSRNHSTSRHDAEGQSFDMGADVAGTR